MASRLLDTYLQFLRSPTLNAPPEELGRGKILKQVLRLYTAHFLLVMVAGALIAQISGAQDDSIISDVIADMPAWQVFLNAVVAAPVIEEIIFRLPLRPFALNIAFSGSIVACLILASVVTGQIFLFIVGMLAGLNLYLLIKRSRLQILRPFYARYARIIFYFFTLLFGAIHITNYEPAVWPLLPLLVLPQTIVALWLGFVRLRYGFKWAIFAHAFHNGCLLLPICLTKLFGSAQLQAQGLEKLNMRGLAMSDQILVGSIALYTVGGVVACVLVAWRLLKEHSDESLTVTEE